MRKDSLLAIVFIQTVFFTTGARSDFYLGAGLGYAELDSQYSAPQFGNIPPEFGPAPTDVRFSQDDADTAWKLFAGWQFTEYLGLELAYQDLGGIDADLSYNSPLIIPGPVPQSLNVTTVQDISLDTAGVSLSGRVSYPNSTGFTPYASAGLFLWREEFRASLNLDADFPVIPAPDITQDEEGTSLALALGVDYRLNDRLSLRGNYDYFDDVAGRDIEVFNLELKFDLGR